MMLEGTDHQIHCIDHSSTVEAARRGGKLRPGAFVRLRTGSQTGDNGLRINDLGPADQLLTNRAYLRNRARSLLNQGVVPQDTGLSGWLGRYEVALVKTATAILAEPDQARSIRRDPERGR